MPDCTKMFFLHIPKTAGSAFNHIFKSCVPEGRYFEHMESRRDSFLQVQKDGLPFFLSGHFSFHATRGLIERPDVFSITILRSPVEQLLSHLKWVKYVGSPRYPNPASVPGSIMDLARVLYQTPLSDVAAVSQLIDNPTGRQLFDNLHVRYLTRQVDRIEESALRLALENLRALSFVFVLEDMPIALARLRRLLPTLGSIEVFNVAPIKEAIDFQDSAINDFFLRHTTYDRQLYETARAYSREHCLMDALA